MGCGCADTCNCSIIAGSGIQVTVNGDAYTITSIVDAPATGDITNITESGGESIGDLLTVIGTGPLAAAWVAASWLPLAGGTLTGTLSVENNSNVQVGNNFTGSTGIFRHFAAASAQLGFGTQVQATDSQARIGLYSDGSLRASSGTSTPDVVLDRQGQDVWETPDRFKAVDGLTTKVKAGTPTDADFAQTPEDGTIVVDTTASKIWVRIGGVWKQTAALT